MGDELMTPAEAAAYVGLSEGTVTTAIRSLKIRSSLVEGRRLIARADLDAWRAKTGQRGSAWRKQQHASYRERMA